MPRKRTPFLTPDPERRHGLSPVAFQVTRLSAAASMAFGHAMAGDAEALARACEKAQTALDRIKTLTGKEPHE